MSSKSEFRPSIELSALDKALVGFVYQQVPSPTDVLLVAMAMTSHSASQGHVCLPVGELVKLTKADRVALGASVNISLEHLPKSKADWINALTQEERIACVDAQDSTLLDKGSLLVLDKSERLYLPRFFDLEQRLLSQLKRRANTTRNINFDLAFEQLNQLFGTSKRIDLDKSGRSEALDWQKVAVCVALLQQFAVISGGPGTGKTTTVIRLIALLLLQPAIATDAIALVAPTGKAAARLSESIAAKIPELSVDSDIKAKIPIEASTVHRLLGIRQDGQFRYHKGNKLNLDVLIVDEASMVDIALMVRLLEALPDDARVILLGDKDQLASVEAGSVLADLCQTHLINQCSGEGQQNLARLLYADKAALSSVLAVDNNGSFSDCITELKHSYRFDAHSGIGQLAYAVNAGDVERSKAVLDSAEFSDAELQPKTNLHLNPQSDFALIAQACEHYSAYLSCMDSPIDCLAAFNRFRVLTAVKEGAFGSTVLNEAIAKRLKQQGKIAYGDLYYAGLPVMVMQNNYQVNLFNGDIGIFIRMPNTGELRVVFDDGDGGYRDIAPALLPQWEPAFVMTVHKSQGSEFDTVAMVLPDQPSPLLTREMLYTGVTRAKNTLSLYASEAELKASIITATERYSGLSAYL